MAVSTNDFTLLSDRWARLKQETPSPKIRDAAVRLGVSEATLLGLGLGAGVRRLTGPAAGLLGRLAGLGPMMALTRNAAAVHELRGEVYGPLEVHGNVGLIHSPEIDLRLDFSCWAQSFAEVRAQGLRTLRSLQFFDAQGTAVHKVYLEDEARAAEWEALVQESLDPDQEPRWEPALPAEAGPENAPEPGDRTVFLEAWDNLRDPHHFHGLLRRHRLTRRQGLAAAEGRFTRRLTPGSLAAALGQAADQLPIMAFVGNPGCTQIHTGPIRQVRKLGSWINVLDPGFNLHVDLDLIAEGWAVTKPSPDGPVTSVEFLTAGGELAVQLFGARKPGVPELPGWTALVAGL